MGSCVSIYDIIRIFSIDFVQKKFSDHREKCFSTSRGRKYDVPIYIVCIDENSILITSSNLDVHFTKKVG